MPAGASPVKSTEFLSRGPGARWSPYGSGGGGCVGGGGAVTDGRSVGGVSTVGGTGVLVAGTGAGVLGLGGDVGGGATEVGATGGEVGTTGAEAGGTHSSWPTLSRMERRQLTRMITSTGTLARAASPAMLSPSWMR